MTNYNTRASVTPSSYTWRPWISFIVTELLDFLMTEDNSYLITNDSIWANYSIRPRV
jgi:hypothetical protein